MLRPSMGAMWTFAPVTGFHSSHLTKIASFQEERHTQAPTRCTAWLSKLQEMWSVAFLFYSQICCYFSLLPSFKGQLVLSQISWKRTEETDQEDYEEKIDETPSVLAWQLQTFQFREGEAAAGLDLLYSWKSSRNTPFSSSSVSKFLEKPAAAAMSPGQTWWS